MIEVGDYVSTADGHSGKIRSICSNDFIVILEENSNCYVCKRCMIIGEKDQFDDDLSNSKMTDPVIGKDSVIAEKEVAAVHGKQLSLNDYFAGEE